MKKIITVKTKDRNCNILIENNSIISSINNHLKNNERVFLIIDIKLSNLLKKIKINNKTHVIKIIGSEKIKSIENYSKLISKLLKFKVDRSSTLIAIGGGTVGDLSGFVASTVLRGIRFVLIPTTLLAQVDSSIGGKNGINTIYGKNLIGTFWQPDKVIIDPNVLKSLKKREIKSGYAEILKYAMIKNKKFYHWLLKNYSRILNLEEKFIIKAIIESIKIKSIFVEKDEKENLINNSSRAMLNFGHTFGHALEAMNNYNKKLTHGEAISIGMAFATKISSKINKVNKEEYSELINHLKKIGLPFYDKRINSNKIYDLMLSDKKTTNNKINLILLKEIGSAYFERGLNKKNIKNLLS